MSLLKGGITFYVLASLNFEIGWLSLITNKIISDNCREL